MVLIKINARVMNLINIVADDLNLVRSQFQFFIRVNPDLLGMQIQVLLIFRDELIPYSASADVRPSAAFATSTAGGSIQIANLKIFRRSITSGP